MSRSTFCLVPASRRCWNGWWREIYGRLRDALSLRKALRYDSGRSYISFTPAPVRMTFRIFVQANARTCRVTLTVVFVHIIFHSPNEHPSMYCNSHRTDSRPCPAVPSCHSYIIVGLRSVRAKVRLTYLPTRVGCKTCMHILEIHSNLVILLPWLSVETIVADYEPFQPCSQHSRERRYHCDTSQSNYLQCRSYEFCWFSKQLPWGPIERCGWPIYFISLLTRGCVV